MTLAMERGSLTERIDERSEKISEKGASVLFIMIYERRGEEEKLNCGWRVLEMRAKKEWRKRERVS